MLSAIPHAHASGLPGWAHSSVSRASIASAITAARVMAVIRLPTSSHVHDAVRALIDGGMRVIEITMTIPGALNQIEQLAAAVPDGVVLGAGTVIDSGTAIAAIDAGARFVVSPVCRFAMIEACHDRGVVMMPGCLTPTEILAAHEAGADFVKVFPASAVGPAFIRDIKGPLPGVRLVPTGGIGIEQAAEWLLAGASAVGVGGGVVDPQAIAAGDFRALTAAATRLTTSVRDVPLPPDQAYLRG